MIALNFIRCYHPIIVLLIFENVFYLEKNDLSFESLSSVFFFFICSFFICMTFWLNNTSLNTVSYSTLFMLYDLSDEMWDVGNVVY